MSTTGVLPELLVAAVTVAVAAFSLEVAVACAGVGNEDVA